MDDLKKYVCGKCGKTFLNAVNAPVICACCGALSSDTAFTEVVIPVPAEDDYSLPLNERIRRATVKELRGLAGSGFISEHPTMRGGNVCK